MVPEERRCEHIKSNGKRCKAPKLNGSSRCYFHDPSTVRKRKAASRRGGRSSKTPVLPQEAPDFKGGGLQKIRERIDQTINDVSHGRLHPSVATAVCSLLRLRLRVRELTDHEQRIARLEEGLTLGGG